MGGNLGTTVTYDGSDWSAPTSIDSNNLYSVSCPTTTFSAATDDEGNTLTYDGSNWSAPTSIDNGNALTAVSCSSSTFCMAVDFEGNVLSYDGGSWAAPSEIGGNLSSVSCPTTTFCAAVTDGGRALIYSGPTISQVSFIGSASDPEIEVTGTGFGTVPASTAAGARRAGMTSQANPCTCQTTPMAGQAVRDLVIASASTS